MRKQNRRTLAPFVMLIAGVLLIAGAVVTGIILSRSPTPSIGSSGEGGVTQISPDDVPRVSLEEAKSAFDSSEALFVDVRSAESYAQDHIPGSVSIPLNQVEARLAELERDSWIITYCT
jgi:3-mercaptopyruvate sulfurtransferase SseA